MSKGLRQTDKVAKALGTDILSGNQPIGDALPGDDSLRARFGVSRTVIREALRLLGSKGLIVAKPRTGTLVAESRNWALWDRDILLWLADIDVSEDLLRDGRDMRLAIEPMLAALAASRADESGNRALQQALRNLQTAPDLLHEQVFLEALYTIADNHLALAALPLARFCLTKRQTAPPLGAYRELTAAIAQKNATAARQIAFQSLLDE